MDEHRRKIDRTILIGWGVIVCAFLLSYLGEVLKGERTLLYFAQFAVTAVVPYGLCAFRYHKAPEDPNFAVYVTVGYLLMYAFCLLTGHTVMVFSYILPMLSFLVLCHCPRLIAWCGGAALAMNVISVAIRYHAGEITLSNSKDI